MVRRRLWTMGIHRSQTSMDHEHVQTTDIHRPVGWGSLFAVGLILGTVGYLVELLDSAH